MWGLDGGRYGSCLGWECVRCRVKSIACRLLVEGFMRAEDLAIDLSDLYPKGDN